MSDIPIITARDRANPTDWAVRQRDLIATMDRAADPDHHIDRARALRCAAMYTDEDPLAPNWDSERRMIRLPLNLSAASLVTMPSSTPAKTNTSSGYV